MRHRAHHPQPEMSGRARTCVQRIDLPLPTRQAATRATDGAGRAGTQDCVILLHGLGRTRLSLRRIERRLLQNGYRVVNQGYPSRKHPVERLADHAIGRALAACAAPGAHRIHFVTHSLGGILVRQYLQDHCIDGLGRIVMLCPPNQGSEIAQLLKNNVLYRFATGPAGQQLGTGPDSVPRRLDPIPGEIGIIAGTNDHKVPVARARLTGMQDFLVVHSGHTFIMNDARVIGQVLQFLGTGRFIHKTT
jgi:predicted alpha/beta hydrolase family esterase